MKYKRMWLCVLLNSRYELRALLPYKASTNQPAQCSQSYCLFYPCYPYYHYYPYYPYYHYYHYYPYYPYYH